MRMISTRNFQKEICWLLDKKNFAIGKIFVPNQPLADSGSMNILSNSIRKEWKRFLIFMVIGFMAISVSGLLNPAAVYCKELGYKYIIEKTAEGERGICKLPDGSSCEEWNFLKGKCGKEYSYCKQKGYELKAISDPDRCSSIFSDECAVCILKNGTEVEITELMGLDFKEGRCGDGVCVLGENYKNCPEDCKSGSLDGYCDGVVDGICDPDCNIYTDKDCSIVTTTTTTLITPTTTTIPIIITTSTTTTSITTLTTITTTTTIKILCGNGRCESGENYANCPKDCKKEKQADIFIYLPYVVALFLAVVIAFFAYKKIKEKKRREKEEKDTEITKWVKEKLRSGEDPKVLKEGLSREGIDPSIVDKAIEYLW